ncbi:tripartite tricarboxylate transporter substrate-binding protein [Cupriavidus oxalaticus]|uniref:tripartite tricarboxylate transporter substrate-binding protein n=1 Tax=Cupriavidus oxalaticus TaxID=96344 RepID=UPI003175E569
MKASRPLIFLRSIRSAWAKLGAPLAVAALAASASSTSVAQQPETIKLLVGYQAGGGADTVARALAHSLQAKLKTTVIVLNKPGAAGALAAQALKLAPADGTTFMLTSDQFLITPMTLKAAGYDAMRDFQPVAGLSSFDMCFAVNTKLVAARTLKDYLAAAAKDARLTTYGVPAMGSLPHFYGYVIGKHGGLDLRAVPYKGGAPMVIDLAAGFVPAAVGPCREMMEQYRAGKVRLLAAVQKVGWAPEVPTMAESGIEVGPSNWQAVFASAKVPAAQIETMQNAIRDALAEPAVRDLITAAGFVPRYIPAKELRGLAGEATTFWSKQIRESRYEPQ